MPTRPPGIKAGLTRAAILSTALAIADEQGLPALTMRRLSARLGVEAMTLYDHVPSKAALIDAMVESVIARASEGDAAAAASWREGLRGFARSLRTTLDAHPGVLPLMLTQSGSTPGGLDRAQAVLATLSDAGFSLPHAMAMVNAITLFTTAYAMSTAPASPSPSSSDTAAPDLAAHPLLRRAAAESAAAGGGFEVTIDAILAGFDALRVA